MASFEIDFVYFTLIRQRFFIDIVQNSGQQSLNMEAKICQL